jgi:PAS domain S-box-containing protein
MDTVVKIKNLLKKDQRGLNIREISEKLSLNRNSVAKVLDILTAKEEVEIRTHGRSKIYYLTKPQDYRKWFGLLSRTIEELNNFPPDGDIYPFMAGTLSDIAPEGTIIFINSFDPETRTIRVNAAEGLGQRQPDIEAILCRPLKGLGFPVPDRIIPEMLTGECDEIPGGLTDLTFGGIPYETCKKIESMPFFGKVYSAGISWKGRLKGTVTFILPKGAELANHDLITFFIRQVAGFLSRRDAEAALKESDQFTREIIHNTKEGIVVYDRDFNYLVWNPFMESLTGISASESLGKNAFTLFPHLREQKVDILLQRALEGETVRLPDTPYHVPRTSKSGYVSGVYSPHFNGQGAIVGVIASISDITERKQAEEALKESEVRYRIIFENTGTAMVIIEEDTTVGFANKEFFRLTGYSQDDIDSGRYWTEFVHKDDLDRMVERHKVRRSRSGDVPRHYEFRLVTKSGAIRNILLTVEMVPGTQKSIASLIDITDRKRIEEALQESEEKYRIVAEGASDGIAILCGERLEYVNPALAHMAGYTVEELTGASFSRFILPESVDDLLVVVKKAFSGKPVPSVFTTRVRHHDGHLVEIEVSGTIITWKGKKALLGFIKNKSGRTKTIERGRKKK